MSGFTGDVVAVLMAPLDHAVSAALLAWHEIVGLVLDGTSGWGWALAVVGMTVTIRILIMPFYVGQARVRREMRQLEPQVRELKAAYGDDPERLSQEQMKLLKTVGMKPFLSFLPLVLLGLVLFSLFRIIDGSAKFASDGGSFRRGFVTGSEARSLAHAELFGARITDSFFDSSHADPRALVIALMAIMCVTHVAAQRAEAAQLPPDSALSDPFARQHRFLLLAVLVGMAAIGLVLPIGVLIFWATSKVWTVGQERALREPPGPAP